MFASCVKFCHSHSPSLSRTNTPKPTELLLLRGHQCWREGDWVRSRSGSWALRKSWSMPPTKEVIIECGCEGRPRRIALRQFHKSHAARTKIFFLWSSWNCKDLDIRSKKSVGGDVTVWLIRERLLRTISTSLQPHTTWRGSFSSVLQLLHSTTGAICLRNKLSTVGSAFLQARQAKCLTLLGIRSFQIPLQKDFWEFKFELLVLLAEVPPANNL